MNVQIVNNEEQLKDAYNVRKIVFVEEQQVPMELEIDELESEATHFVLYEEDLPIGAGRLRFVDGYGKVERICILKEYRGSGAGRILMEKIEFYAREQGSKKFKLNAQTHAIPFYSRLGYEVASDEFLDAGIPHKTMVKTI